MGTSLAWVSARLGASALGSKWTAFSALALSVTAAVMTGGRYAMYKYIYALLHGVGVSVYAAPGQYSIVAVVGLCLFPGAQLTHSTWVSWNSPRSSAKGSSKCAAEGVRGATTAALASKQRNLEAVGMTRSHSSCSATAQPPHARLLAGLQRFASIPAMLLCSNSSTANTSSGGHTSYSNDTMHVGASTPSSSTCSSDSVRHDAGILSARPTADLDIMANGHRVSCAASPGAHSPRRRVFNLGIPRVHVELSPLPRLCFDFRRRRTRQQQQQPWQHEASLPCTARRQLQWASVDSASEMHQHADSSPTGSQESAGGQGSAEVQWYDCTEQLPSPRMRSAYAADGLAALAEAPASLGLDQVSGDMQGVAEIVTDTHLLQFGAMLGEQSSRTALAVREAGGPVGHPDSFYGSPDTDAFYGNWEPLVQESNTGVRYWAWRRPLRKGLHMYMTRTVFANATPSDVRSFLLDDTFRVEWDDNTLQLDPIGGSSSGSGGSSSGRSGSSKRRRKSAFMHSVVRFPKPMTSRVYTYARRVWPRPSDGGCFCLSKAAEHPAAPNTRGVNVEDFASGYVLRAPAPHLVAEGSGPCCEQLLVYFEDSHVRPSLANLGIRKGLWPLVQRTERALRAHQANTAQRISMGRGPADSDAESEAETDGEPAQDGSQAANKPPPINVSGSSGWSLLGVLKRSGAALLGAGAWLWRTQAALSTLLPRLELRMLRWAFSKVLSPRTAPRLLGSSSFRCAGGSGPKPAGAACVGSWPLASLYDGGAPYTPRVAGVVAGLRQMLFAQSSPQLRRLGSFPIALDDHQLARLGSYPIQLDEHPLRRLGSYPIVFEEHEHEQLEEIEEAVGAGSAEQQVAASGQLPSVCAASGQLPCVRADEDSPWPAAARTPLALAADGTWVARTGSLAHSGSGRSSTRSNSAPRSNSTPRSSDMHRSSRFGHDSVTRSGSFGASSADSYPRSSCPSGSDGEAAVGSEGGTPTSGCSSTHTSSNAGNILTNTPVTGTSSGNRRERRRRGGTKQRFLLRLVQAAGLRLAHQLLVAADSDARRHSRA